MQSLPNIKVLWLAPNFNHYKARFLNRLQENGRIALFLHAGIPSKQNGYADFVKDGFGFQLRQTDVPKEKYGHSLKVLREVIGWHRQEHFDWIMVPCEAKNLVLILVMSFLKLFYGFRLFSYNHAVVGPGKKYTWLSKQLYHLYDRVVFYTENERKRALDLRLLPPRKAFFANNTLDTTQIAKNYSFQIKDLSAPSLLFIGRLIANKRIELLLRYYQKLKQIIPGLQLLIIGDGPDAPKVKTAVAEDSDIRWFGALADEEKIAPIMSQANAVINLGASGLSVMHSFAYGKPYIAIENPQNGPECWYLRPGENGILLKAGEQAEDENVAAIVALLSEKEQYEEYCDKAYETARRRSVQAWVKEIEECLTA